MTQVINRILSNDEDDTRVHLAYACRTSEDILCKEMLDEWAAFWNFSVVYCLSQEVDPATRGTSGKLRYGDRVRHGRVTEDVVREEVGPDTEAIRVIICGTRSFDKDMINFVKRLGLSEGQYHKL